MIIIKYWKSVVIAIIILLGSLISGNNIKKLDFISFKHLYKIIHLFIYFSFAFTLSSSFYNNSNIKLLNNYILSFTFGLSYGILMELLQSSIAINRTADTLDIISNIFGTIIGLLLFTFLKNTKLLKYL